MLNTRSRIRALLFILLGLMAAMLAACSQQEEAAPTPTQSAPPTAAPTRSPDPTDAWSLIQKEGTMVVGTSADYPPFAYYTNDFQLDGFDIALIRAVAGKLGVEVELRDMAFDGLGNALTVNQIDAAIAAISVTDQRREQVDFSSVYLVAEDAVLARAADNITLQTIEDAAEYRIGVQSGSVYQQWLVEELVDTGLIAATNVFLYQQTDQAIEDLANGFIDLVVGDAPVMDLAAETGRFSIAARGLNLQQYAIALPKGSSLTPEINQALLELQNDGTLADLLEQYLNVTTDEVAPVPTPLPTPTQSPTPLPASTATPIPQPTSTPTVCVDAMRFVGDLNYDDQNMTNPPVLSPGQPFQKGWRIQNTGTCTWDARYMLVFTSGNVPEARMGGLPTPVQGVVPPGGVYDMYVNLVAPLVPGTYQAFWTMRNAQGLLFGDRIWVGITVPAQATPTPAPTATPSASIQFTVDRTSITSGECVTFSWNVQNARAVYFYALGEPFSQNEVPNVFQQQECPAATTTYELRVLRLDNQTETRQIRIDVAQPPPTAPVIEFFNLNPAFQITEGQCTDVSWRVNGDVTTIRVLRDSTVLWDGAPLAGTSRDCPPAGQRAYVLEVSGPGGSARAQNNLNVVPQPTPPPQFTPTPIPPTPTPPPAPPPVINSFAVSPTQILAGECVSIQWAAGGNVDLIQILRDGSVVVDNAALNGFANDCLSNAGTYVYRIEASNNAGQSAFQQASVVVGAPPPPAGNPLKGTSWRLTRINGAGIVDGTEVTALFGDSGNLSGSGGCNTYNGSYTVDGAAIGISPLVFGLNYCASPPGVMEQEALFSDLMTSATGFSLEGGGLVIRSSRGQLEFANLITPR